MRLEGDDLVAEVPDDGRGFDPTGPAGIGLRSIRRGPRPWAASSR